MDQHAIERIRNAVGKAEQAARAARLDSCDTTDIDEASEAVRQQLGLHHPGASTLTLYLNSIARSLIGIPAAREALEDIDAALREAGLPATWEQ
ncbi:MAG: hypothetical protein ACRET5_04955 [Steroidobacteraceae bacterium]